MTTSYETEIVRRVYDNDYGEAITVSPSPDFPGNVLLHTEPQHEKYFGALRLDLPASMMRQLAQALLAASDEADRKE